MTLKGRVEEYCKYARISISAFERRSMLSNGYFNQVKKEPSPSKLSQIKHAFPDLNIGWLLTGEGGMLKTECLSDDTNQPTIDMQNKFFDALERKDRQIDELLNQHGQLLEQHNRLISVIESMSGTPFNQTKVG